MTMDFRDNYKDQLKDLEEEEAYLARYLHENINSLNDNEVLRIKNQIAGIRSMQEEINQIITGGFY